MSAPQRTRRVAVADTTEVIAEPEVPVDEPDAEPGIHLHMLADGMTIEGKVYVRGEEFIAPVGSAVHTKLLTRKNKWWKYDRWEQIERYGEEKFDQGPWRGAMFDLTDSNLTEEERKVLTAANTKLAKPKSNGPGLTRSK